MPTDLPLPSFIGQVILHTPVWVWVILVAITALGLRQMADQTVTLRRLVAVPLVWSVLSLMGAAQAFGAQPGVLAAWAVGVVAAVAFNQWLAWPRGVQALGDGRFALQGSVVPLMTMWSVFVVRYATGVMLALDPALRHGDVAAIGIPLAYGLLSGIFVARTVRILRSARLVASPAWA